MDELIPKEAEIRLKIRDCSDMDRASILGRCFHDNTPLEVDFLLAFDHDTGEWKATGDKVLVCPHCCWQEEI